jgi:hypothetical protein
MHALWPHVTDSIRQRKLTHRFFMQPLHFRSRLRGEQRMVVIALIHALAEQ